MKIEGLLKQYSNSENTLRLLRNLNSPGSSCTCLKGLVGSSASLIIGSVAALLPKVHLCILPEPESAAYLLNDLENTIGEKSVWFFPASTRNLHHSEKPDTSAVLLRAEVMNSLLPDPGMQTPESKIIVTYPEAIREKVVTRAHLLKNTLRVQKGERLSSEFITDLLVEYGFNRVDYVLEPGQFSVRGGIIDFFSFSFENPIRMEFSGDEVDSIRSFDTVNQLSLEQLERVTILPDTQSRLLEESSQPFLEFIPADTIIWLNNAEWVNQSAPNQLSGFNRVEFGNRFFFNPATELVYDMAPQPAFNKNFEMLIDDLNANDNNGFQNILFSDTEKQVDRLHAIIDGRASFTPIHLSLHEGFTDRQTMVACYTDHQVFGRYHRYRIKNSFSKTNEAMTLKELKGLNPGDYITHIDHGIGRYAGLEKMEVNGKMQEAIRLVYKDNDILYVSIHSLHRISKYGGKDATPPKLNKLGSNSFQNLKLKTKKKVKEIAFDLIRLYAERKAKKGFAFGPDNYLQDELEASFIYEDTPDQLKATRDVKKDMEDPAPMDRLVCGDVGFGKTEIAIRAAFKAAVSGKQVAVLVPTTILALQHFRTFSERLRKMACTIDYISRFKSTAEQKETLQNLSSGKTDIIIGTHRVVGKDVHFKDLGLLIIDEEQKFGVGVKDKLKTMKSNVDTLTLTATPIPRTLQFSMMGARDLSIINTPPLNRYPVQTELHSFDTELIREAILFEVSRGGQIFFIHNRVGTLVEIELLIRKLCPDVKVLVAHGQMDGGALEEKMISFINGDYDVLVSTTIVESGLDIPNANTMIINDAQIFGLSDLHQLRGRVGRSNKKAFCYLLSPPLSALTAEAQKRLRAIAEFSDLGSGFQIAMRDLDIRGAGNLLGAEQSGFITEIGYEMYQKILDEAMDELREEIQTSGENGRPANELPEGHHFVRDCLIDTDLELLIPDNYVGNITERLGLYRELDESKTESDLDFFKNKLTDRFGEIPPQTLELINTIRLRWLAVQLGFEKIILKNRKLTANFTSRQNSGYFQSPVFTKIVNYVQRNPRKSRMKEHPGKLTLTFEPISGIGESILIFQSVLEG